MNINKLEWIITLHLLRMMWARAQLFVCTMEKINGSARMLRCRSPSTNWWRACSARPITWAWQFPKIQKQPIAFSKMERTYRTKKVNFGLLFSPFMRRLIKGLNQWVLKSASYFDMKFWLSPTYCWSSASIWVKLVVSFCTAFSSLPTLTSP